MNIKQLRVKYQIKVSLHGWKPPIWRRLLVPSGITLDKLHLVIQHSMGWENCHLHKFKKDELNFEISENFIDLSNDGFGEYNVRDESKWKLSKILTQEKEFMEYEYDFGDSWIHRVILEKVLPYELEQNPVVCIKGKRACPPEDCGGLFGYHRLLTELHTPSRSGHNHAVEFVSLDFDYEYFDLKSTNHLLQQRAGEYA